MIRTYKYRIYATPKVTDKALYWLELCRCLYNCALAQRIMVYKSSKKTKSCYSQMGELIELKGYYPEYKDVGAQTLQDVLSRLENSYSHFFRQLKTKDKAGFPRFRGKNRYNSFVLKQNNWKIDGKYLYISKLGKFKIKLSRDIPGDVKSVIIKRSSTNKWHAHFVCDGICPNILPNSSEMVGIDVGVKSLLSDSNGNKVSNPRHLKNKLNKIRIDNRKLSRAKRGSNKLLKAKLRVAKDYEKVSNQRDDFLHKLANSYVRTYGIISIENLQIGNMVKNHKLARDINDCSWGKFFELLTYKAEEAGRSVIKVNPKNTSKICSKCGSINHELRLNNRIWICQDCGTTHDRDKNAAINIKRLGQSHQSLTCAVTQSVG